MDLEIIAVVNSNKPEGEYVRIRANADINLRNYAVIDRTFGPSETVTNEFRHIFPFPSKVVKAGEYVRLHTGLGNDGGKYEREVRDNKVVIHHFFWKSKTCIWNNTGDDVATLFHYSVVNSVDVAAV